MPAGGIEDVGRVVERRTGPAPLELINAQAMALVVAGSSGPPTRQRRRFGLGMSPSQFRRLSRVGVMPNTSRRRRRDAALRPHPDVDPQADRLRQLHDDLTMLQQRLEALGQRESDRAGQLLVMRVHLRRLQAELRQDVKVLQRLLMGNGKPGIHLRVDRLEHHDRQRRRYFALLWGAIVAALANAVAAWFVR